MATRDSELLRLKGELLRMERDAGLDPELYVLKTQVEQALHKSIYKAQLDAKVEYPFAKLCRERAWRRVPFSSRVWYYFRRLIVWVLILLFVPVLVSFGMRACG